MDAPVKGDWVFDDKIEDTMQRLYTGCYDPTLEELLEECAEDLESLIHRGNNEGDEWEVRSKNIRLNATSIKEALIHLYIALHPPQSDAVRY